ncbi:MAG: hypothetical protein HPY53_03445 [Brevinematales bacterium]|nr:hypothetical protein [Brevinematales bacterium]
MQIDLKEIGLYIIYFLPGFISSSIYYSKYPNKKKEQYQYLGYVLFNSLVLIALVTLIFGIFDSKYLTFQHLKTIDPIFIFILFLFSFCYGQFLRFLHYIKNRIFRNIGGSEKLFPRIFRALFTNPISLLNKMVEDIEGKYWVLVKIENNQAYFGLLKEYFYDHDDKDYQLYLSNVLLTDHLATPLKSRFLPFVYIPKKSIISIEVIEYKEQSKPDSKNTKK